jgi:S-DNA-T family DNA segregation ATPase FtsK/SpoIIIE
MSKQNTLRKKKGKTADFESEKKNKDAPITRKAFWQWILLRDERAKQVFGAFLMLTAIFMSISFVSFLFTWKTDQNVVFGFGWDDFLASNPDAARNTMGMFGALLGHIFIHKWFGIASFAIPVILIVGGAKLAFKIKLLPILKTIRYSFFIVIWLALLMGMLLGNTYPFLGGAFGYHGYLWLKGLMGAAGAGIFLFFYLLTFLIVVYNLNLAIKNKKLKEVLEVANDEENEANGEGLSTSELAEETAIMESEEDANTNEEVDASFTEDKSIEDEDRVSPDDIKLIVKEEDTPFETKEEDASIPLDTSTPEPESKQETSANDGVELSIEETIEEEVDKPKGEVNRGGLDTPYDPTLDLSGYKFPTLDLLKDYGDTKKVVDQGELENNKNMIVETLKNYGIGVGQIKATIGPTVTLYEIVPEAGVRISRIKNLEDDIALSLAALGIRIIAPIPGKGTIGIEVPNKKPEIVPMSTVSASAKFKNSEADLPVILGKTIANEIYVADLAKMPHLLMAGATGQGKSVGINALLVSLLYKKHPSQLKFVLVDPKKVELTLYKRIERHYLAKIPGDGEAIITDTKKVVNTLNSLCVEMDERYNLLQDAAVRNIKEYNARFVARKLPPTAESKHKFLPYIVVVIDELADLMMTAGKEVEQPIARLAQLARAIGIHLIIATQRPSVNIITGTIKANFPARIAFRVTSKIDSRTILDTGGADQLIGKGDMLFSNGNDMIRLQCPFVDTPEVEEITSYIGNQRGYPDAFMLPEVQEDGAGGNEEFDPSDRDSLFEDAARVVVLAQQGSTSLVQRKLKLGYNRAGRIIDQLENAGIVGPFEGSKAREVLIPDEYSLEQKLKELNG